MTKIKDIELSAEGKKLTYRNNPTIRRAGTKINLSREHIEEYIKCKNDIIYFAENYVYINDPNLGRKRIVLYDFQRELLRKFQNNRFVISLQARQSAKSTTAAIYIVWLSIFHIDKCSAILANKANVAREIFSRCLETFEMVPHFLKPGVHYYNQSRLELDNGSEIHAAATSKTAIRGFTINGTLFLDECIERNTHITIRNKETKEIEKIKIGEFYKKLI